MAASSSSAPPTEGVMFGPRAPEDESSSDESDHECALFMRKLPSMPNQNETIAALTALAEEPETPESLAEGYKFEGNDHFDSAQRSNAPDTRRGFLEAAYESYTQGLLAHSSDQFVVSALYANRAAVDLALQNFGKCLSDCRWALKFDELNIKAVYRAVTAAKNLEKHAKTLKYARLGLTIIRKLIELEAEAAAAASSSSSSASSSSSSSSSSSEPALRTAPSAENAPVRPKLPVHERDKLHASFTKEAAEAEGKVGAQQRAEAKQRELKEAANKQRREALLERKRALDRRGLVLGPLRWKGGDSTLIARSKEGPRYEPTHCSADGSLQGVLYWPALFLYDEHGQSDFIESFCEHDSVAEHLEVMFPQRGVVPWDVHGTYSHENLHVYLDVAQPGDIYPNYVKLPDLSTSLLEIFRHYHSKVPIPGLPVFYVMPKNSTHTLPTS